MGKYSSLINILKMEARILLIYVLISFKIGPPLEKFKGGHWPPLEKIKGGHWPLLEMKGVYHPGHTSTPAAPWQDLHKLYG